MVETASDEILKGADTDDVAFLVVGDPFGYDNVLQESSDIVLIVLKTYTGPLLTRTLFCEPES